MNHICTWLCVDGKGEESYFPQSGKKSSSQSHQNIYWRCLIVFYITSKRFNRNDKHILFTNAKTLPVVDGLHVSQVLDDLGVKVVHTDFKYRTPKGYFGMFQNQFYEFSIIEWITRNNKNQDDQYLILDSDCIFLRSAAELFKKGSETGFMSFAIDFPEDHNVHGLSRRDMKALYEDLLGRRIDEVPEYHMGEFLMSSVSNLNKIFNDFLELWPELLRRNEAGMRKFNEEAHTLSYLYYKNGLKAGEPDTFIKRMWTNPVFFRNIRPEDVNLTIWHLPAEKTFGLARLYDHLVLKLRDYGASMSNDDFLKLVQQLLSIPSLSVNRKLEYYTVSYFRAVKKRVANFSFNLF